MQTQLFAGSSYPVLECARHVTALEVRRHLLNHVGPKLVAYPLMNRIVPIHGKAPRLWSDQKNDGVPVRMFVQLRLV